MSSRVGTALHVREAADALAQGCDVPDRAGTALGALADLVGSGCVAVQRWDPVAGRHTTVASTGYSADAVHGIEEFFHADPLFGLVGRTALRVRDIPPGRRHGPVFDRVIDAAGFADGVSVCLTAGRRYVGSLHASTGVEGVADEATQLLTVLRPDFAALVDPLDGWTGAAVDGAVESFAWHATTGRVQPLTAGARPDLLPALVPPAAGARLLLASRGLVSVDVRRAGGWWVAEHRASAPPAGLSPRELEVLAEVTTGATNREIARRLGIRERTVEAHLAHLSGKLGVPTRAAAAGLAARLGLVRV
ncbi:LuxR C-terminal-related transcriptional regulator [Klenkia sp. PcliD-1-E]|uniref:helix-turn-helix transcriptional regulator n=1 Tax=Klenkia sp. PcliD-1-E TaxID=2954492 RepID=UPI00209785F3|nr:LuxR C-terminal-related transcriptional regulator [Klenkia sp. PcliD-1-E]MCO7221563.1 LuxR C-terminal-related transcriptional regulator [Klenkia sp. PcliD-1-E]